jgi:hypothetical protein
MQTYSRGNIKKFKYQPNYGGSPDRLPIFQLVLRKEFDKLEKELIHCLSTIVFAYR